MTAARQATTPTTNDLDEQLSGVPVAGRRRWHASGRSRRRAGAPETDTVEATEKSTISSPQPPTTDDMVTSASSSTSRRPPTTGPWRAGR